jgi:hypothetical protein
MSFSGLDNRPEHLVDDCPGFAGGNTCALTLVSERVTACSNVEVIKLVEQISVVSMADVYGA